MVCGVKGLQGYGVATNKIIVLEDEQIGNIYENPPEIESIMMDENIDLNTSYEGAINENNDLENINSNTSYKVPIKNKKKLNKVEMQTSQHKILQSMDESLKQIVKIQEDALEFKKKKWCEKKELSLEKLTRMQQ